jgi:hypothetical protein
MIVLGNLNEKCVFTNILNKLRIKNYMKRFTSFFYSLTGFRVPEFKHPYRYGASVLHFCKTIGKSLNDTRFAS